jgi:hypothetical protein
MINLPKRDIVEQLIPSNLPGATRLGGTSGGWSGWGQIITAANLTYDFVLCGAYVFEFISLSAAGVASALCNYQIAKGKAFHEGDAGNLLAEDHSLMEFSTAGTLTAALGATGRTLKFAPVLIPAGTRLAYRTSSNTAIEMYSSLYLVGYNASQWPQVLSYPRDLERYMHGLVAVQTGVVPSPGQTTVTTGTSLWAYGTPVEFIASAAQPLLVKRVVALNASILAPHTQVLIELGAAGHAVAHSKAGFPSYTAQVGPIGNAELMRSLLVLPGERVSVSAACSLSTAQSFGLALQYEVLK